MMNDQQKHALAEFVIESAKGIESGDIAGVWPLWQEMANEAEKSDIVLPLTQTIRMRAAGKSGEMSDSELAAWLKGWAFCFDS